MIKYPICGITGEFRKGRNNSGLGIPRQHKSAIYNGP